MEFFELINKRHSIRSFQHNKAIEKEKLEQILNTVNRAPSAGNLQAYEIVVVRSASIRAALAEAALYQHYVAEAPVVLVFFANKARSASKYGQRGAELYSIQDATIACAYAQLAATALGLGSVWVGAFDERAVAKILNVPDSWRPIAILPIGYPAIEPEPATRRAIASLVHYVD